MGSGTVVGHGGGRAGRFRSSSARAGPLERSKWGHSAEPLHGQYKSAGSLSNSNPQAECGSRAVGQQIWAAGEEQAGPVPSHWAVRVPGSESVGSLKQ